MGAAMVGSLVVDEGDARTISCLVAALAGPQDPRASNRAGFRTVVLYLLLPKGFSPLALRSIVSTPFLRSEDLARYSQGAMISPVGQLQ